MYLYMRFPCIRVSLLVLLCHAKSHLEIDGDSMTQETPIIIYIYIELCIYIYTYVTLEKKSLPCLLIMYTDV